MANAPARALWVVRLETMEYAEALALQRAAARARIAGLLHEDLLLLVEHPPVVTLGRTAKAKHLTSSAEFLAFRGVQLFEVERGGDVTFHGPGQLVGYPIIDLKRHTRDLHWYLRQVEKALMLGLGEHGIPAERSTGYTGVWTHGRKIASIGVHARDWVTWHGFALNVNTDLSYFDLIVPCGIAGVDMTSMRRQLGVSFIEMSVVESTIAEAFARVFDLAAVDVSLSELEDTLGETIEAQTGFDNGLG